MRSILLGAATVAAMILGASSAQAAAVLNVDWNANCGKATCFSDTGSFSQTFSSTGFDGPVNVSQFLLDRGVLGSLDSKTFRITFQLNGEEIGTWGSFNVGGIGGDELTFGGESFVWNPEDGDLVLVLALVPPPKEGAGGGGGGGGFSLQGEGESFNGALPGGDTSSGDNQSNDVRLPPGAVPEPATWAMMIAGFGMAGAMMRRRRAVVLLQP
jgi:hypothetical protein